MGDESGSFDGVYFHCSIERQINDLYKFSSPDQVKYFWDGLHRCGLVDKHLMDKHAAGYWIDAVNVLFSKLFSICQLGCSIRKTY